MYGKKRIVLNKLNQIILAGKSEGGTGGSWIPIGKYRVSSETGVVVSQFLKEENLWDGRLTDENSVLLSLNSISETRDVIRKLYKIPK